jgi:DNA-nicking Smr family endonuclease
MKPPKPESINRPFEALKDLLQCKTARKKALPSPPVPSAAPDPSPPSNDEDLFAAAMSGVQRMDWNGFGNDGMAPPVLENAPPPQASELECLRRLVDDGQGFLVSSTPEYMEGVGYLPPPEITRRLHRGDFAVQAHLDLHGLCVEEAREVFDAFMKEAVLRDRRAVLIIHGRGLCSPAEPVLKAKVAEWLTSGYWRKWVVAFTSARLCDGGSGASYVLLRRRPLPKRHRRGRPRSAQRSKVKNLFDI